MIGRSIGLTLQERVTEAAGLGDGRQGFAGKQDADVRTRGDLTCGITLGSGVPTENKPALFPRTKSDFNEAVIILVKAGETPLVGVRRGSRMLVENDLQQNSRLWFDALEREYFDGIFACFDQRPVV